MYDLGAAGLRVHVYCIEIEPRSLRAPLRHELNLFGSLILQFLYFVSLFILASFYFSSPLTVYAYAMLGPLTLMK